MKKTLKAHDERNVKQADSGAVPEGALPTYLLDREGQRDAKALSSALKQKRKDKAAKYAVPLPKVRGIAEDEMFKVVRTGKSKSKAWKRMVTKATFVGEGFTRKPVKMERFIRPMALRYKKANVTHRKSYNLASSSTWTGSPSYCSRVEGHFPTPDHGREEEPSVSHVYSTGRLDQGYNHRSQRFRVGHGHHWR
jgi:ribosomal protein S8E